MSRFASKEYAIVNVLDGRTTYTTTERDLAIARFRMLDSSNLKLVERETITMERKVYVRPVKRLVDPFHVPSFGELEAAQ